uniref:Fibronectin type III domain-containing protein n=1 Tax=Candidatus Kentrum eta TaxID=2126337 RepID=A0A450V436_9GAMM|nr:MAG: Fibronectin type III domain-containing protein [Candidatus Kentron sp. H]VFJ99668.1 MAG: Fibronectin type III domain-containing protein [Candidatus Kentron sp. H]VFK04225.1 MAG: Fibronectin type III domain-containing protein [Candidatus Kentron sp. H]
MPTFPIEEIKVFELGQKVSSGLKANIDTFPNPPINPTDLDTTLATYVAKRDAAVAARATAEQANTEKRASYQTLKAQVKKNLRYAEMTVDSDDDKLKTLGWGAPKEPSPLTAPGQTRNLVSGEQGSDSITLSWKKPAEGGKPASYEILLLEGEEYRTLATAITTSITLTDQERGKALEYAVVAINRAGRGPVSNVVRAVL